MRNASDVITVLDADGTIRYDSPAVERVLGYKPEERIGTNALDYLHPNDTNLGFGILKLMDGIGRDAQDTAIVQTIVELAHILGLEVVGEGVETNEQAEWLREMGCYVGQGFYFARPLPPEAISRFLENNFCL